MISRVGVRIYARHATVRVEVAFSRLGLTNAQVSRLAGGMRWPDWPRALIVRAQPCKACKLLAHARDERPLKRVLGKVAARIPLVQHKCHVK